MSALHISISAEPVLHYGPLVITNSMLTSLIVSGALIGIALTLNKKLKTTGPLHAGQNLFEMIIEGFYNLTNTVTQNRLKTQAFFPIVMTAFLWIMLNNWLGLLPGVGTIGFYESEPSSEEHALIPPVNASEPEIISESLTETTATQPEKEPVFVPLFRAGTADLNTTLALAMISVLATQFMGFKFVGFSYLSKFFNTKGIYAFVGFLEFVGEISKILSFAFRLFGNIFAGEVLLAVMAFLIPVLVPTPFLFLEIFVGAIQALVFALLTLVFMNMASLGHEEEH